jgi:hypothetical protein
MAISAQAKPFPAHLVTPSVLSSNDGVGHIIVSL